MIIRIWFSLAMFFFVQLIFLRTFLIISRLDSEVYDDGGNSLQSLDYDRDMEVRTPASVADDLYSFYYAPEKRWLSFLFFFFFNFFCVLLDVRVEHLSSLWSFSVRSSFLCESLWQFKALIFFFFLNYHLGFRLSLCLKSFNSRESGNKNWNDANSQENNEVKL